MTKHEAIKELEILKEDYWDDDGYGHETKQYDDTMLALDMAINALGQETILNKIRAEIAELSHYYPMGNDYQIAITRCLAVIDKYKAAGVKGNTTSHQK